jgi:tricorn protease
VIADGVLGYYRYPVLNGDIVVFAAEGDLWTVSVDGGLARRLTTHPGEEKYPSISPDGKTLAFSATYEGPMEVYTIPLNGGLPDRHTWTMESSIVNGWDPSGRLVYTTNHYATKPNRQLVALDIEQYTQERIPLAEASEGVYNNTGDVLFFVRPTFHNNVTKRYRGGTARKIWRFNKGAEEAVALTPDYDGESHSPMWWKGRGYFITDRDGTMNIWSMGEGGEDLKQHTRHSGWDVREASINDGRLVYQVGADLWFHDIVGGKSRIIPITLASDVDQWREKWVTDPMKYLTEIAIHPEGKSVALTARGRVFVIPTKQGRLARVTLSPGVRYRDAGYMPDGKSLLALSDATGEFEFVELPVDGVGGKRTLTKDGTILRFSGYPSPDGVWIVYTDNNQDVWLLNAESGKQRVISTTREWSGDIAWSPDSRWVAFVQAALNSYAQIALYNVGDKRLTMLTSDRVNSFSPTWDPAGNWLYFLSDRHLQSLVTHPWGPRQPEPYFDKPVEIYQVALRTGLRSPFRHTDELYDDNEDEEQDDGKKEEEGKIEPIALELEGIEDPLALVLDRLVVFIMDGGWGEEPQAGVIMFVVIPLEKGLTPGACIFQ